MRFSYHDLKMALYCSMTVLGAVLIAFAAYIFRRGQADLDPFAYTLPAIILAIVGFFCLLFGVETFILRDDSDIWQ